MDSQTRKEMEEEKGGRPRHGGRKRCVWETLEWENIRFLGQSLPAFSRIKDARPRTLTHARTQWQVSACSTLYVLKSVQPNSTFQSLLSPFHHVSSERRIGGDREGGLPFWNARIGPIQFDVGGTNKPRSWQMFLWSHFYVKKEKTNRVPLECMRWHLLKRKGLAVFLRGKGENFNLSDKIFIGDPPLRPTTN